MEERVSAFRQVEGQAPARAAPGATKSGNRADLHKQKRRLGSRRFRRSLLWKELLLRSRLLGLLGGLLRRFRGGRSLRRTLDELDQRTRRRVARTETHLQDAHVTAGAGLEAGTEVFEQLADDFTVAQAREREATVRQGRVLAHGDERLRDAAQLFRLGDGGHDFFVAQQRDRHVAEHGQAVGGGAVEFTTAVLMTHKYLPNRFSPTPPLPRAGEGKG